MTLTKMLSGGLALAALCVTAACTSIPNDMTVAQYCANPDKASENVCRLKVEIDGQSTALADTNMRLSDALSLTATAQSTADQARADAAAAMARAEEAMAKEDQMLCETRTIQKSNIGTCREGYTLTSCTQTRFTYRAGGPSILREINDQQCRFQDRVLEMQVRCCGMASAAPQPADETIDEKMPEPAAPPVEPPPEAEPNTLQY
ncbi:hypothetical protein K1X12_06310 [Hyphomonas sp. WL0036]|uniref:hypothetical protein n=1 Tax=Hyphomonas sediminis TaxID=2866160 RepID=UPI001C827869|nr:hypothetical protein [Hyphomonas sediminis]MBY9066503.1 hypothetical protein [Hyphomonas sediminis]